MLVEDDANENVKGSIVICYWYFNKSLNLFTGQEAGAVHVQGQGGQGLSHGQGQGQRILAQGHVPDLALGHLVHAPGQSLDLGPDQSLCKFKFLKIVKYLIKPLYSDFHVHILLQELNVFIYIIYL